MNGVQGAYEVCMKAVGRVYKEHTKSVRRALEHYMKNIHWSVAISQQYKSNHHNIKLIHIKLLSNKDLTFFFCICSNCPQIFKKLSHLFILHNVFDIVETYSANFTQSHFGNKQNNVTQLSLKISRWFDCHGTVVTYCKYWSGYNHIDE